MLKIPGKQPETRVFQENFEVFQENFLHSRIRLHLSISFFSAKCNLNRGNLIGPGTVEANWTSSFEDTMKIVDPYQKPGN